MWHILDFFHNEVLLQEETSLNANMRLLERFVNGLWYLGDR